MGVESFYKLFEADKQVSLSDFKGKTFAIDAYYHIHRCISGMPYQNRLRNSKGEDTTHIHGINSLILNLYSNKINQIWVFDSGNINKKEENEKRKEKRKENEMRAIQCEEEIKNIQCLAESVKIDSKDSDFDGLTEMIEREKTIEKLEKDTDKYKKRTLRVTRNMIKDIKFILNQYNISWIDAPKNFEAEHIAACLNQKNIVDAVLTNDSDTLLFGAKQIIKISKIKKKKIFLLYSLNNISTKYKIDLNDLIKVGLCLGTDFNKKGVKGIGIKTVLKKYKIIDELLDELKEYEDNSSTSTLGEERINYLTSIKKASDEFNKKCPNQGVLQNFHSKINNIDEKDLNNKDKIDNLLKWISEEKDFNRSRIEKLINNAIKKRKK